LKKAGSRYFQEKIMGDTTVLIVEDEEIVAADLASKLG